jgi:hypothetical protein
MMSIKKFATTAVVAASMLAANLAPFAATAASAKDWRKYDGHSYSRSYDGHKHYSKRGPRYAYGHRHHRHGNDTGKGIAIGLGILAVGAILASQAHR